MEASAKALVVDDDGALRSIVAKMLSVLGYEVSSAETGETGLRVFLSDKFDLVLSDYEMPGMDGFALARNIKQSSPDTPFVLMTGSAKEAVLSRKAASVDRVLFKPFTLAEMGAALSSIA